MRKSQNERTRAVSSSLAAVRYKETDPGSLFRGSVHIDLCEELWTTKMHSQQCRAFTLGLVFLWLHSCCVSLSDHEDDLVSVFLVGLVRAAPVELSTSVGVLYAIVVRPVSRRVSG
ncbi:hypothetical protein Taro_008393 [Colocasia esculenta]|uniref:Uncharacterized protein n=1 Tax=Colocasia esculenta TaxID=4460 RepID=A0A843TXG0_COLES|nr:hypothetical protein [Colocasia esculenta]